MAKKKEVFSIMYWTAPERQETDPAKAVKALYRLVEQLAEEVADLTKKVEKLEGKKVLPFKKRP
jgi:hypothetical protein